MQVQKAKLENSIFHLLSESLNYAIGMVDNYLSVVVLSVVLTVLDLGVFYFIRGFGLHMPGYRGLILMALLVVSKFKAKNDLSAILVAVLSSIETVALTPVVELNIPYFITLIIPAATLDAFWFIIGKLHVRRLLFPAVAFISGLAYMIILPFLMVSWNLGVGRYLVSHFVPGVILLLFFAFGVSGGAVGMALTKGIDMINSAK